MKVIVVGAGSFGSWSALKLLQAGCEVTLIDAWGPGNSRSSSGGETRVIRTVYGEDDFYVDMAYESIAEWDQFQKSAGESLMEMIGSLWFCGEDDSYARAAVGKLNSLGLELREIKLGDVAAQWPQVDLQGLSSAFLEPLAGFLRARKACDILTREFVKAGGKFVQGSIIPPSDDETCHQLILQSGETLTADQVVVAAGPWIGKLFPKVFSQSIQVSRQEVYYFGPPCGSSDYDAPHFPIWLDLNQPIYYGIPSVDRRGFKVARDERGKNFDPDADSRLVSQDLIEETRDYLRIRFPALADSPLIESRVCQYTNTLDGHFVLDRLESSGIIVVGGGSGHGFKMGPSIGNLVQKLVLEDSRDPRFALQRFEKLNETTTQFDHS